MCRNFPGWKNIADLSCSLEVLLLWRSLYSLGYLFTAENKKLKTMYNTILLDESASSIISGKAAYLLIILAVIALALLTYFFIKKRKKKQ